MKNRMRMLVAAFGIVCGIGLAFPVQQVAAEENTDDTTQDSAVIPEHISIGGTDVSGMSLDEANAVVQQYVDQYQDVTFTLTADDKSIEADGDDIGLCAKNADVTERALNYGKEGNLIERFKANADMQAGKEKDFSISLTSDTATVEAFLNENKSDLVTEAVDNTVKRVDGKFEYVEGSEGVTLMTGKSAVKIADFISTDWDGKDASIELLTEKDEPRGTKEELESIQDVLGSYHTDFGTVVNGRTNNIKTGASKLDGLVVYPGETISVSEAIGPTTAENGYYPAGSYENGTTVETYGGGICQVSTTLYNAVIRAELKIVERFPHSMTVHYVPRSADAAIAGTHKDMKFKNTFDTPIYIEGKANGSTITFTVYGKKKDPKRTVEFLSETTQVKESSESTVSDNTLAEGQKVLESYGHTGYSARLWKIVKINGKQVSKKVFNTSTYMSTPTVYRVGTKKAEDKKDDKKDKKKDSKETTAQKSETTTAAQKSTTAAQKSTTAKRSAAVKSQGSTGN